MNTQAHHKISPTPWGYWGYWGYFSQVFDFTGLFANPLRGYFGGYFLGRGFIPYACADRTLSKMETVRKSMTAIAGFITVRPSHEKKVLDDNG